VQVGQVRTPSVGPAGRAACGRTDSLKRWYLTTAAGERPSCPNAASVPSATSRTTRAQGTGSSWYPGTPRRRQKLASSLAAMMRAASSRLAGAPPPSVLPVLSHIGAPSAGGQAPLRSGALAEQAPPPPRASLKLAQLSGP